MKMELGKHYIAILADGSQLKFQFIGGAAANVETEDGNYIALQSLPPYSEIIEDPSTDQV